MLYILGAFAILITVLGGLFALKYQDKLHLILGFSAGAVIGVAFFDLLPEAIELAGADYDISLITTVVAIGFLLFMFLNRVLLLHPHTEEGGCENEQHQHHHNHGVVGAASLSIHSLLDGVGIGLAFQVSPSVGLIVAVAVLAHYFSDGINTVSYILTHGGTQKKAFQWLSVVAIAPFIGILSTRFFSVTDGQLGLLLALFCGFFLYIGASDLLPESHHRHPKLITSAMTILGTAVIYLAIHFAHA